MRARFAAAIIAAFGLCWSAPSGLRAQEVNRIAAVVNDDIISVQELDARAKSAIIMANLPDSIDARRRVVPQVLRKLIEEHLQMQEASRLKIALTSEELARGIASIEQQNHMPAGALMPSLQQAGIDPDTVREQIRAQLLWIKVASRTLQPNIRVSEDEVTERLDAIKLRQGRPEYNVADIFLAVENMRQDEEAHRLGERLLDQLRAGAPFPALARQFSQAPSASNGGAMGWIAEGSLDPDLDTVIATMPSGSVSPLVRAADGYHILALVDKRLTGAPSSETTIDLVQMILPVPPKDAPPRNILMQRATEMTTPLSSCHDMEELGRKVHSEKSGRVNGVRLTEQPLQLRKLVEGLPPNKASAPIEVPGGMLVVMVCARSTSVQQSVVPTREAVRRAIEDERMDMLARRYMRDLQRSAFIDTRM
jgi:peptidyl-prolyl cis-trans isomerase SurA